MDRPKITLSQIKAIVEQYHSEFPTWTVVGRDMLVRTEGWLAQVIWFDRLRTGRYRPTCSVSVLCARTGGGGIDVLTQFLGWRCDTATLQEHREYLFPLMVDSIKKDVFPSVLEPIDPIVVAEACASKAPNHVTTCYALASLYGALGRMEESRYWIRHYHQCFDALGIAPSGVDKQRYDFLHEIQNVLTTDEAPGFFAEVADHERAILLRNG